MNVALVANTSWNLYHFRMGFIKALIQKGHIVHTVAPQDKYTDFLTHAGCRHHTLTLDAQGTRLFKEISALAKLWRIYRNVAPDAVFHYTIKPNLYGTLAAVLLKIPVVNNVSGLGTVFLNKSVASDMIVLLYRFAFRFPKKVFFQNKEDLKLFVDRKIIAEEIADLVPGSGIDLKQFTPVDFTRNKPFTFLLISRLIVDKGILEYIEAARKIKKRGAEIHFQLLGAELPKHKKNIEPGTVNRWVEEGIVEYFGFTDDIRPFIARADCIVLPSYREGAPRALMEAASCAKPIVTTNVPGCCSVVDDHVNGLLCNVKDVHDLAEKMIKMAAFEDETLKNLGANGRKKMMKEFDEHIVIDKYMKTFSAL